MQETYIQIMLQSLEKKSRVLDQIIQLNEQQKTVLESADSPVEDFDETVEKKSALIEQMEQLDSGFEKLYDRVREELRTNKDTYKDQIRKMQDYIRAVTDKSVQIQTQEARNKELMTSKFARVKKQARQVRTNFKATSSYYQSMNRTSVIDPQFMDDKK